MKHWTEILIDGKNLYNMEVDRIAGKRARKDDLISKAYDLRTELIEDEHTLENLVRKQYSNAEIKQAKEQFQLHEIAEFVKNNKRASV